MSVRNAIVLLVALSALTFLAACGSGNSVTKPTPPPTGGFSNSNLNGTYVFSASGSDASTGDFLTIVGAFAANGSGGITGGAIDVIDPAVGVSSNQPISSGSSYSITSDGRGQAKLNANTVLGSSIGLDFVLTSSSHGLVTEFDSLGTGSGTIDLQSSTVSLSGLSYAFSLSGVGSTTSFATAGSFTLGASGNVTAGVEDFNNGGAATSGAIDTTSTVAAGAGTSPGTAQLVSLDGTLTFDVYAIDSTHLKFIETDLLFYSSGDAFTQGTSLPTSGTLAFTMSGFNLSNSNPLALGGLIPLGASSAVSGGGVEDFNDGGTVGQDTSFGGGFAPLSGGRSVLNLTAFANGGANDVPGTYAFAAYPFSSNGVSGVALLEIDGLGVTSGAAFLQTTTTLAASQGYGLNLSAINLGTGSGEFEEDDIAEFTTASGTYTGIVDLNDEGTLTLGKALTGAYQTGGTGRYTATTTNYFNYDIYVVNSSTYLIMETDADQIGTGILELQNASASPGSQPGISMLRSAVRAHAALRHK